MKSLRETFDDWAQEVGTKYCDQQWLLSKWEWYEDVVWSQEKRDCLLENIRKYLDFNASHKFIELGCGGGWLLQQLSDGVSSSYGLDFSQHMLKVAATTLSSSHLMCADLQQLPYQSNSFDRVLSYFVFINMVEDRLVEQSILEIVRVLKKGGRALVGQLPDQAGGQDYEEAKKEYIEYWQNQGRLNNNIVDQHRPPLRLFDRQRLIAFLNQNEIHFQFKNSFNPFYRPGQPKTVSWRFDLVLTKK